MLNFFLPIGHLHRLRMLFLLSHPLLFPLMWRLYCLGVDNKGHTCSLLIGYEWLRITVEDDCFLDVLESRLGSSLIHSSFSILHHSWLTLSVTRNTWPCFVWFSLIRARNWEPFLFLLTSSFRNFMTKFRIFYQPDGPVGNRFNRFSTIVGWLCRSRGTPDLALFGSHLSGLRIENRFFFLLPYSFRNFMNKFGIFYQADGPVGNRFNWFSTIVGWLC